MPYLIIQSENMTTPEGYTPPEAQQEFREKEKKIKVFKPATEYLLHPEDPESPWPEEIKNNPELKELAEKRRELSASIRSVFEKIPDPTKNFADALKEKQVSSKELTDLYNKLAELLSDPDYGRLVLYLPFELIPEKNLKTKSKPLSKAASKFTETYMQRWHEQLNLIDDAESFIHGDIPEQEVRVSPIPQVVKAAHLVPHLIEKNYLTPEEVKKISEEAQDDTLKNSLDNALAATQKNKSVDAKKETMEAEAIDSSFNFDRAKIEEGYREASTRLPLARVNWLKRKKESALVEKYSEAISTNYPNSKELLQQYIESTDPFHKSLAVEAIYTILSHNILKEEVDGLIASLDTLKEDPNPNIQERIVSTWAKLKELNIVSSEELEKRGIHVPIPDEAFSAENNQMKTELAEIAGMVKEFEEDHELSQYIYPAAIVFGSKVKGYGLEKSDQDVAIFVKPNTPESARQTIQKLVQSKLGHLSHKGKVLEFWLKEKGEDLEIIDFEGGDSNLGNNKMAPTLEGVWVGAEESIQEMYKKLMPGYLKAKDKTLNGTDLTARNTWLNTLEMDTLQYRLMHTGYYRYHPKIETQHAQNKILGGQSAFWDPGYRRLATKLFIEKVFLPDLEK